MSVLLEKHLAIPTSLFHLLLNGFSVTCYDNLAKEFFLINKRRYGNVFSFVREPGILSPYLK